MTFFFPAVAFTWIGALCGAGIEVAWDSAVLSIDATGRVISLKGLEANREHAVAGEPFCAIRTGSRILVPLSAVQSGDKIDFGFAGGLRLTCRITTGRGFSLWELQGIDGADAGAVRSVEICRLLVDGLPMVGSALNGCYDDRFAVAVMGTKINVRGHAERMGARGANLAGVTHSFRQEEERAGEGHRAARFAAASSRENPEGWSVRGRPIDPPLDLRGLKAIKARIRGDGKGELLKIQLTDGKNGYRDDYIKIDFTGWREITCDRPALNTVDPSRVSGLHFYYNGLPAKTSVECWIDDVHAALETPAGAMEVHLEDFEDPWSELWDRSGGVSLLAEVRREHGLLPAGFGIVACPRSRFEASIDGFEKASGLPNPHPGGTWSKLSPLTKQSYLFITSFGEKDVDPVIAWARRGGFSTILIGGESWSRSHGHHEINRNYFPDGLPSLERTAAALRRAGFRVGLHFLAAAVYLDDPYVGPRPDPRLYKDAFAELAADIDEKAVLIPTAAAPTGFPAEDGGYEGMGTFIQIGEEIVQYGELGASPPGFARCLRGALKTTAGAHKKGEKIAHLLRSYGYFLFDLDSTLAEEVVGNVCSAANAIEADMLYFDGSERLQGDHWYYNAKLQDLYYRGLKNKDALLQGSSYSHYSWHLISRMASADGHGDVKRYLDERMGWFNDYDLNRMPLDIGWYYVYDPGVTADQFDYILQKCLGFGSSISVQTNPRELASHPEMGAIVNLVGAYEKIRLSGKVPEAARKLLREPGREYRFLADPPRLRRAVFGPWQEVRDIDGKQNSWTWKPAIEGARLGVQVSCGPLLRPGEAYRAKEAMDLETFEDLAPYSDRALKEGVSQSFESVEGGVEGRCGKYTATSSLSDGSGWSAIGKRFERPLDLSSHAGVGLWLKGDGKGGSFKLQIRDRSHATDYYIQNDFKKWRYIQLPRPTKPQPEPIDYSKVEHLMFYYNGLPARTTVACWIDGVKALPALDAAGIVEPEIRSGEKRVSFPVTLREGERLIHFPDEAPWIIPVQQGDVRKLEAVGSLELSSPQPVTFTTGKPLNSLARVRLVEVGAEEIALP